jgi:hypothetical protein
MHLEAPRKAKLLDHVVEVDARPVRTPLKTSFRPNSGPTVSKA